MPTFLHTADLHLDTTFSAHFTAEQAKIRRNEMLRCVSNLIDLAKNYDILLIAGDVFDSSYVSEETVSFLKRKFAELEHTYVFISAGNHDPYTSNSVYANTDFGDNVHIFGTEPECVELAELKTRVYGCSFSDTYSDIAKRFNKIDKTEGITDIILMHADVVSNMEDGGYNSIDRRYIEGCGADYLALGHIHTRSEIKKCGNTYFAYPGLPEGRGFDECGDMGCYIGEINDGAVKAEFKKLCIRRLFKVDVDISGLSDNIQIFDKVKQEILSYGCENDMYKINVIGKISSEIFNIDILKNDIKDVVYYAEVTDNTQQDYDIDAIAVQNTLCGEFVRMMQDKIKDCDDEERLVAENALMIGLDALLGGEV